ncbi:MAG: ABC transporter substrate-binding protein [Planctomycetes bacterium]|nr:ABC transporter substrate-binding protein [Planctomycetota bacterium]
MHENEQEQKRDSASPVVHGKEGMKTYERIISLYSAHTENLFALGLDAEIIGVSRSETYPPEALAKPSFDPRADAETFLAAKPDLVLVRPMIERAHPVLLDHLKKAGIAVVSLQPRSYDDMFDYWRELGSLTGKEKEADALVHKFMAQTRQIRERLSQHKGERARVYFESMHKRMKTFSPRSITMSVLREAGGENVATDAEALRESNIASYGKERILLHAKEIDAYLAQRGAMNDVTLEAIKSEPGFDAIKAVRDGNILIVDEEKVSRPTPRLIEGITGISRFLYPRLWDEGREASE